MVDTKLDIGCFVVHDLTTLRKAMVSKNSVEGSEFGREVGEIEVVP